MSDESQREVREPSGEGIEVRRYEFTIKSDITASRLDSYLASRFPDYSRTFVKKLLEQKAITVNGLHVKPSYSPRRGDRVVCLVPVLQADSVPPEDIPLDIIYEDDWLLAVNKPPDIIVHPARGHQSGTLVNALVHHCRKLSGAGGHLRPGIVHRLDRDTSGIIMVVKDDSIHREMARQFHDREVHKEYLAVCEGIIELDGDVIDAPLGPDKRDSEKMAVREDVGKEARTVYEVVERMICAPRRRRSSERDLKRGGFTLVRCLPHTGRTHQIRVHMQWIGHPVVADSLYGFRDAVYLSDLTGAEPQPAEEPLLERQALHARRLTVYHPILRRQICFEAEVPGDMQRFISAVREHLR